MINVNNITSTLAKLPDQALQQYAMMHKNDPYIMSLAMSESTRRKELRAAQGAQGEPQEQPKVVDQAIAGMAPQPQQMPQQMGQPMPEDSGIGQLPAGDMEFAGGGILAFAAGDLIPGPKDVKERWQDMKRRPDETSVDFVRRVGAAKQAEFQAQGPAKFTQSLEDALKENKQSMVSGLEAFRENKPLIEGLGARPQEPAPVIPTPLAATNQDPLTSDLPANNANPLRPAVVPEISTEAPPPTGIQQVAPVAPVAAIAAPVEMDIAGKLAALKPFYKDVDNTKAEGIANKQGKKEVDSANKNVTDERKFQEEMGEYGVGREKRLKEREGKLEKDEKSNYGLAFLEAGLAMMGGESPNAFANISKGALQGMGGYKKGLASLNDRKDKLFDAYDSLEDAKRSDKKDRFSRTKAAEAGVVAAEGRLSDNLFKLATTEGQTNAETARALATASVSAANTEYQVQSQTAVANAQIAAGDRRNAATIASSERVAAMPSSEQRLIGSLDPKGKGDPRRGYEEQQRIKSQYSSEGKFNMDTAYAGYISDNQAAASLGGSKLLTKSQFAAMFGPPSATANPTSVVRD